MAGVWKGRGSLLEVDHLFCWPSRWRLIAEYIWPAAIPWRKTYATLSNFLSEALGGEDLKTAWECSLKKDWRKGTVESSSEDVVYLRGTEIAGKSMNLSNVRL